MSSEPRDGLLAVYDERLQRHGDMAAFSGSEYRYLRARIADLEGEMWGRYNRIRDLEVERDALAGQVAALHQALNDVERYGYSGEYATRADAVLASTESVAREWTAERDTARRHAVRLHEVATKCEAGGRSGYDCEIEVCPLCMGDRRTPTGRGTTNTAYPISHDKDCELATVLAETSEDCARWSRELEGK